MSFKTRLREEISYQGLLLKELASKADVSKRTLETYVDARGRMPAADVAVRIAAALGVSVEYLVTGQDSRFPSECKKFLRFKNFVSELDSLSDESWDKLQPLFLAMMCQEKRTYLQKNKTKVQDS